MIKSRNPNKTKKNEGPPKGPSGPSPLPFPADPGFGGGLFSIFEIVTDYSARPRRQ